MRPVARQSLLRDATFRIYYAGQTVALFGAAVTPVVIPLVAAIGLHATGLEASVVAAASLVPGLLFMLPVGAMVDRWPKRQAMLRANIGEAAALWVLPVLWWLHALSVPALCAVGFASTSFAIVAQVADQSLIPHLVDEDRLVEGNSKLALSESAAGMVGPTAAGFLVSLVGGPLTIGLAALGSMFSALSLARIRSAETPIDTGGGRTGLRRQITDGLRFVAGNPILRSLMTINGVSNVFLAWIQAILTVFYVRTLHWTPPTVGVVLGVAAVGGIAGAAFAGRLHDRLGSGRLLVTAELVGAPAELVVLLLRPGLGGEVLAALAQFAAIFFSVCYSVTSRSLRQAESPDGLRSSITAAHRWVSVAVMPLGALAGGIASTQLGLRGAIALGCAGLLASPVVAWTSPLRRLGSTDAKTEAAVTT